MKSFADVSECPSLVGARLAGDGVRETVIAGSSSVASSAPMNGSNTPSHNAAPSSPESAPAQSTSPNNHRRCGQHLDIPIARPPIRLRQKHILPNPHHRDLRRVLEHGNELVGGRRDDGAHGLGQGDAPEDYGFAHAQRQGRLALAMGDAEDAGAEDFAQVSAVVQRQGDDPGGDGARHDAQLRQAEVDQQDLDQQRRAAKERRVETRNPERHGAFRQPRQCGDETQQRRGDDRAQAQKQRQRRPLQEAIGRQVQADEVGQFVEDDRELQVEAQEKTGEQAEHRRPGQVQPRAETEDPLQPRLSYRLRWLGRFWERSHLLISAPIHFCESLLRVPSCFSWAKTSRTLPSHCASPFSMATEFGSEYSGSPASLKRLSSFRRGCAVTRLVRIASSRTPAPRPKSWNATLSVSYGAICTSSNGYCNFVSSAPSITRFLFR